MVPAAAAVMGGWSVMSSALSSSMVGQQLSRLPPTAQIHTSQDKQSCGPQCAARGGMLSTMPPIDNFDELLGPPATPTQRRRQQASHARFDHAVGLVERAAKAATTGDQSALDQLVARMEQIMTWSTTWSPTMTTPASARPGSTTSSPTPTTTLP